MINALHLTDNLAGRAIKVLREEGIRSLWFKFLSKTGCYRRVLLCERSLEEPIPDIKPRLPVTIDLLKKTEVDEYFAFRPDSSYAIERLNAGHWCFVARHERQLISNSWAAIHGAYSLYLNCEIHLAEGEVYVYDLFTKPNFRGQSVSPAISVSMMRYFHAAGYKRMISIIGPENRPSLQSSRKAGFRTFGVMGYIKIGPWRRDFCKTTVV